MMNVGTLEKPIKKIQHKGPFCVELTSYINNINSMSQTYKFNSLQEAVQFAEDVYEKDPKTRYSIKLYRLLEVREIFLMILRFFC